MMNVAAPVSPLVSCLVLSCLGTSSILRLCGDKMLCLLHYLNSSGCPVFPSSFFLSFPVLCISSLATFFFFCGVREWASQFRQRWRATGGLGPQTKHCAGRPLRPFRAPQGRQIQWERGVSRAGNRDTVLDVTIVRANRISK